MSQITLRGLDPRTENEIRQRAKKTGKSINQIVLEMINQSTDTKRQPRASSLRKLAGGWTKRDASKFSQAIKICEQIDEDMWR
jgi:hypothetical protein